MILIFKNIRKKYWITYTNGATKLQKIQLKINGLILLYFGKIRKSKSLLPNLSIKIGHISVNYDNKSKILIPNLNKYNKLSPLIPLAVLF